MDNATSWELLSRTLVHLRAISATSLSIQNLIADIEDHVPETYRKRYDS